MNEIITEVWIQSIIVWNYLTVSSHAPALLGLVACGALVAMICLRGSG